MGEIDPEVAALAKSMGIPPEFLTGGGGGGGGGIGESDSLVYMGPNALRAPGKPITPGPYAPGRGPAPGTYGPYVSQEGTPYLGGDSLDYDQARMLPTVWAQDDPKKLRDFVNKGILYKLPGFSSDMGMPEIVDAWSKLVNASQDFTKNSNSPWSPYDVMETYNQKPGAFGTVKSSDGDWLLDARTGERIKYVGPRSKTTTAKRIDLSSPEDVRALATQQLTELLGRAPTAQEMAQYRTAITGLERANPEQATTTTTLNDMGEEVGQSTVTSGGVDDAARAGLIADQAKQGPEYGKYQGATTYFNAMMQMLGG